jgi:hypothetical protein
MRSKLTSKAGHWSALIAGTAVAASATEAVAQEWTKHFRVGMQLAINIDAEFTTSGTFNIPHKEGEFDDGFVKPDLTFDPNDPSPQTSNWGYQRGSQIRADGTLRFTRTEAFTADTTSRTLDDNPYVGMELAYGGPITRWGEALIGWEVGYSFLAIGISDRQPLTGEGDRFRRDHAYDEDGVVLPDPGYKGTDSGQGVVIDLNPTREEFFTETGDLTGSRKLDLSLHNLRFGPTLHYEFARRWAVQGSLGGAVGLVTGNYEFDETATFLDGSSARNRGSISMTDVVYGGYINGIVIFHVEEHGDLYAGLQFMSLSDTEVDEGGRRARLNLGAAVSLLVGINWPF